MVKSHRRVIFAYSLLASCQNDILSLPSQPLAHANIKARLIRLMRIRNKNDEYASLFPIYKHGSKALPEQYDIFLIVDYFAPFRREDWEMRFREYYFSIFEGTWRFFDGKPR